MNLFAASIRATFPAMPSDLENAIAEHACAKGRIGNSRRAKHLDERAIVLAVVAHIRHRETPYDAMLANGMQVGPARKAIQPKINEVLARWRGS